MALLEQPTMATILAAIEQSRAEHAEAYAKLDARISALEARSRPQTPPPQPSVELPESPLESTPPPPAQPSNQIIRQPTNEYATWRPEEIGYFDGTGDVTAFVDRLRVAATTQGVKQVQNNLVTLFAGRKSDLAFNWYYYELSDSYRCSLSSASTIDPWCDALIKRFGRSYTELIAMLEHMRYTRKDAANRKDATAFVQEVLRLTKQLGWPQEQCLQTAWHYFEPSLQVTLASPSGDVLSFIRQVQGRQPAWFQIYANFGRAQHVPSPYESDSPSYPSFSSHPPQPRPYVPANQRPPPSYRPHYVSHPSNQRPPGPNVYWVDEEGQSYIYDPVEDAYVAAPEPHHPPGHTPREWGNTHDGETGPQVAQAWMAAGPDHRCNHEGCTHYH